MCIEAVRKVVEENQQLDVGVLVECVLEALEINMSSNNGKVANNFFTQINGAAIGGSKLASVTDIFGAVYIDPVAKMGGLQFQQTEKGTEMICLILRKTWKTKDLENKIKFTMKTSRQELVFLDTKFHLKTDI